MSCYSSRTQPSLSKSSVRRFFRKLTCISSHPSEKPSGTTFLTSNDVRRRRAEALQACGLLQQSKIYGQAPYRDEDDAPGEWRQTRMSTEKNLIDFDSDDESQSECDGEMAPEDVYALALAHTAVPSDYLNLPKNLQPQPTRPLPASLRQRESLMIDVERIKDAESRRLTKAAFLF